MVFWLWVSSSEVQLIEGEGGKSLADLVALNIGQMGENMALGHIDFFASPPGEQKSSLHQRFVVDPDPVVP